MKKRLICGLDIGAAKTCLSCATIVGSGKLSHLVAESVPSAGIKDGKITDSKKVSSGIRAALKKLSKINKIRVKRVYVNLDAPDLRVKLSQARLAFKKRTLIKKSHIDQLLNSCIAGQVSLNRRIIHTGLRSFLLDQRSDSINPAGQLAEALQLNIVLVSAPIPTIKTLVKSVNRAGLALEGIVPSGSAQALAFFKHQPREKDDLIIDLGSALTKIYILQNRLLKDLVIIPHGAQEITQQIAVNFKLSFACAEKLKVEYARAHAERSNLTRKIIIKDNSVDKVVQLARLDQVVASRVDNLLQEIKRALSGLDYKNEQLGQIVITGGGSALEGFLERADQVLGRSVKLGFLHSLPVGKIQAASAVYATSVGLIYFALQNKASADFPGRFGFHPLIRTVNWARDFYREYF
ncbi:cell division protein FtsA [Candidatus Omnitrophota bacterium]